MDFDLSAEVNEYPKKVPITEKIEKPFFFWKLFLVVIVVGFFVLGFYFLNYLDKGKFQSNINTELNPVFNASVSTSNQYSFNPNTQNTYQNNFTIINNIRVCTNGTC